MRDHEPGVQPAVLNEESLEAGERRIAEPLEASLRNRGELVDAVKLEFQFVSEMLC